ncbi:hypothetical protein C6B36_07765 [Helicobacter cinaedi]|nr:hypothetical protein C6B36_07765 [Helicobacter cinaedi]
MRQKTRDTFSSYFLCIVVYKSFFRFMEWKYNILNLKLNKKYKNYFYFINKINKRVRQEKCG